MMYRVIILILFTNLFFMLHATGNISKYINMKYSFLTYSMIYVLFFLTIAEGIRWYLSEKRKGTQEQQGCDCHHEHHGHDAEQGCDCHHEHHGHEVEQGCDCHHEHHGHDAEQGCCCHDEYHDQGKMPRKKKIKKYLAYTVVLIPALTGVILPVATLDSQLVDAKGFSFPALEDSSDTLGMHQVLNPDMSKFMGKDDFLNLVTHESKSYVGKNNITLTDENFLVGLEVMYNFSGNFVGKKLTMDGFTYNGPSLAGNQIFLLRFGIIHCIADSGAFGMMIQFPKNIHFPNDQWYQVTGTLDTVYYPQFKSRIPVIKVSSYKTIPQPKDPYVYRNSLN